MQLETTFRNHVLSRIARKIEGRTRPISFSEVEYTVREKLVMSMITALSSLVASCLVNIVQFFEPYLIDLDLIHTFLVQQTADPTCTAPFHLDAKMLQVTSAFHVI